MNVSRVVTRSLIGAALAVGGTLAVAAPASAHPEITNLNCTAGGRVVLCDVTFIGSAPPVTIRWTVNGLPVVGANDRVSMRTSCSPNSNVTVKVVVTDPNGSATVTHSYFCGSVQP